MKSPGTIYRHYRKLYRKLLYKRIQELTKKSHDNCAYGKVLTVGSQDKIKLCTYNCINIPDLQKGILNLDFLDTCTNPSECNAFACIMSVEDIEKKLKEDIFDYKKYPEMYTLSWVLDKSLTEAKKNPNIIAKFITYSIYLLEKILNQLFGSKKSLMDDNNS